MGAFLNLPNFFGQNLTKVANECNYSNSNILILEGNLSALKQEFPQVYTALMSCSHHRDYRTPLQYAQDLVASWLFEDYLIKILSENGLEITSAGADKERKILSNACVSSQSDTKVSFNGISRPLEIMTDYGRYWVRNGVIDLRDNKYLELCQSKSLFIGISTFDKTYLLIDFSKNPTALYIPHHPPYGFKPAYQVECKGLLKPFNGQTIAQEIKQLI